MATNPNAVLSQDLSGSPSSEVQLALEAAPDEYWTAERMAAAESLPLEAAPPVEKASFSQFLKSILPFLAAPAPRWHDPVRPPGLAEASLTLSPSGDFETARIANRSRFPFSAMGKLFMSFNGRDVSGSAWVGGESALITAGHCLYDAESGDGWADKVMYVPQYHQGEEPVGRWWARTIHILSGWRSHGPDSRLYDIGAVRLATPVAPVTGSLGWAAHTPPASAYLASGYPRDWLSPQYDFDGREMWGCLGKRTSGTNPIKMANNMTRACSGGAWLVRRNSKIYATGLNSFRPPGEPLRICSPAFAEGFLNLMEAVS